MNGRVARWAAAAVVALSVLARPARAQVPVMLQGITDFEFWSTNNRSTLLTRNGGRPGGLGRLDLWGAVEPLPDLDIYATAEGIAGNAAPEYQTAQWVRFGSHASGYVDQFGARYTASRFLVADVGRLAPVVGTFASRRFSTRNPLVGEPDGYPLTYPLGGEVSGESDHFDYRAALVSLPISHPLYVPEPSAELRPALGAGFTPMVGLRIGTSFTEGSYLNRATNPALLFGQAWDSYHQRIVAGDLAFAHGYLETHAEVAHGSYDVPGRGALGGWTYYGEVKYTFDPRFFAAVRVERNRYPFISPINGAPARWASGIADFADAEFGVGYRLTASTLLKASWRGDRHWPRNVVEGGSAFALQLSQSFDVLDMLRRGQ